MSSYPVDYQFVVKIGLKFSKFCLIGVVSTWNAQLEK